MDVITSDEPTRTLGSVFFAFSIVSFIGGFLLLLKHWFIKRELVPKGCHLPPVWNTGIPIVGNFLSFAKSPLGTIEKARKELGGVFTIQIMTEKCTFLIGAEPHATFFGASDNELDQADVYQFMTPIFGKGIIYDCDLGKRRQQMRALGGALKPSMLRQYSLIIAKETHDYLKAKWGSSGQVDLLPSMAELIILTASATLLGPEVRGELFLEVSHLYEMLDQGLTPLSVFFPNAPTSAHAKRDKARAEMAKLFSGVIKNRRENAGAKTNIDILQKLVEFEYKDGTPMTDDEITGMLIAALFAGQHTSSITTSWSLLFLLQDLKQGGQHFDDVMEEMESLEEEPGSFAEGHGITSDVIGSQKKLHSAVKEAIRMHPPLILLMRRVMKPLTMPDGTYIPKGHRVMVSNAVSQRLSEVFKEPNTYNPSRWEDFDMTKHEKYSFIGFGAGIHTCMGESFAFMQIRTILTVMLSMYSMELTTPFPEPNYEAMVVPPKGPNMVKYTRKTKRTSTARTQKVKEKKEEVGADYGLMETDESTVYSREEVSKHNRVDDLWIIVKAKVYDVTNYVDVHQGGENALLKWAGQDATVPVAGPQHPSSVPTLLERYCIGRI